MIPKDFHIYKGYESLDRLITSLNRLFYDKGWFHLNVTFNDKNFVEKISLKFIYKTGVEVALMCQAPLTPSKESSTYTLSRFYTNILQMIMFGKVDNTEIEGIKDILNKN
jgi:hypothetical protein